MKRKFLAIMLSMTAVVCMAGCAGKEVESSTTTTTTVETTEAVTTTTAEMTEETTTTVETTTVETTAEEGEPMEYPEFEWPASTLSSLIPVSDSNLGEVLMDTDKFFQAKVGSVNRAAFNNYVEKCKDAGFTVDSTDLDDGYYAYNSDDIHLTVGYHTEGLYIDVLVKAPKVYNELVWPTDGLVLKVPKTVATVGEIKSNFDDLCAIEIGNTSFEEFQDYIITCKDAGFNENVYELEDNFTGYTVDGYWISIYYDRKVMDITMTAPSED